MSGADPEEAVDRRETASAASSGATRGSGPRDRRELRATEGSAKLRALAEFGLNGAA